MDSYNWLLKGGRIVAPLERSDPVPLLNLTLEPGARASPASPLFLTLRSKASH